MSKLFALKGQIQNYAWGGQSYIPDLLNFESDEHKYAEYWLGAHVNAPAQLETGKSLDAFVSEQGAEALGEEIFDKFGRLPYLFKVLDVHDMLSIQVHPTKAEAEKGYARENEEGIPLTAKNRNYKDDNHKPEIMVALSEFWLLHGFLPEEQLKSSLKSTSELNHLLEVFEQSGYKGLYQHVMEESVERTNEVLRPLIDRILPKYEAGELQKESADYWAAKAYLTFCPEGDIDKGIYSIYFFNIVKVMPGQAVFQDAGIPHAYMEGQNMELMANSDNVLRGGLTPKHVDVPELLKHVAFEETIPNVMEGDLQADGLERIYKSPAPDFELSKISVQSGESYLKTAATAEILIVLQGEVQAIEGEKEIPLKRGEAVFAAAACQYKIEADSSAVLYKASAPV
ncbi:mannose-6-phosphate isomerase, class I [Reichenbachiella ulvae]|uniref:mannose-6-phosphate isomerase n=1 Tax=Reichenbachiella ulvae TaxID=2980104 RepID=A0ABT3CTX9_9BACT|nr:mannose-6-phosphate isomerase, class I [Reichenbachiella ulvae]MCV9387092.1 mannose-6-phosphate isomerase, class I [Reichenbachiella ulvae]